MIADSPRIRLTILGVVGLSMFATLFARLWYLQVIGTEEYQLAAEVQNTREIAIEAPRGRILDAKGRVIVDNRISIVVTLDPQELDGLDDRDAALRHLAEVLTEYGHTTKIADLEERLADPRYNPVEPRPIVTDASQELEVYLLERQQEFPAVDVRREAVRVYPYGTLAAHVLGYVGRIGEDEYLARMGTEDEPIDNPKPYERDDSIGETGVERVYEDQLRGIPGRQEIQVDATGEPIRTLDYQAPVPGNDLQLTIDVDVQALAEAALVRGLEAARARPPRGNNPAHQAPAGSVVVEDPRTGAIVAMASYPTYDPSEFVGGISSERYAELLGDESSDDPFTNRAIAGQYAPGSTFKMVTAYGAMRDGLINANSSYYDGRVYTAIGCTGSAGCEFSSPEGAGGHVENVTSALTASSDVFFYSLGDRYWIEDGQNHEGIQDAAEDLGLHQPSGVGLPFEQSGWIPTAERRQARNAENPEAFPNAEWYSGDNINLSIGQGEVLVTPLQLVNAYSTFANHGTLHVPSVVARVLKPGGSPDSPADVLRVFEPEVTRELDIPPEIWDPMHQGFLGVTSGSRGTATRVFAGWDQAAWPLAGKTGTAQVTGKADTAVFVGYGGPEGDVHYAISVILEEAGFGADAAGPVARWILEPLSGQVELPRALTLAEQEAGGPLPECPADEPTSSSSTTTTSTTINPVLEPACRETTDPSAPPVTTTTVVTEDGG